MPLLRYFTYVGGALLALLFVVSAFVPQAAAPVAEHNAARPVIRIASDKVRPPRVDLDTSVQTAPAVVAILPKPAAVALPGVPVRDAMAQLTPPAAGAPAAAPIKAEPRVEHKKTRVARRPDRRFVAAFPQPFMPFRLTW
jgi:hypothetical protein